MLYGKKSWWSRIFGTNFWFRKWTSWSTKYKLNQESIEPRIAYQLVQDEMLDEEGNARLNLAFCQTYMEPEAVKLMSQTLEKWLINQNISHNRNRKSPCVNMIADLWNASENEKFMGTSTIGSSEACMLGAWQWNLLGVNVRKTRVGSQCENRILVISSGYQVCWEKFCVLGYWKCGKYH